MDEAYQKQYASSGHIDIVPEEWTKAAGRHYEGVARTLRANGASGRMIDYGGGWGGLCRLLLNEGYDCRVVEPSDDMAEYCRKQGLPIIHGTLDSVEDGDYGVLALVGVFEHLTDHQHWLLRAHELLVEGGLFVTMQPNASFATFMGQLLRLGRRRAELPGLHQTFCPPWHTVLFTKKGMCALAERHGFKLKEIRRGRQGRAKGLTGVAQRLFEVVDVLGWQVVRTHWPLSITHIYVFERHATAQPNRGPMK